MSDEQRVRVMAGWIGVEISRSRVRTPQKAGFGLYRVRGSRPIQRALGTLGPDMKSCEWFDWTAYAFTLGEIRAEVELAISVGIPAAPADLMLRPADGGVPVPVVTRWTSAYRGRRDLGVSGDLTMGALAQRMVDRGFPVVDVPGSYGASVARRPVGEVLGGTVRQRQRAANAEFQAEHLRRRAYGLKRRYEAKGRRSADLPERSAGGRTGPSEG
jgi:hypothetical protein